jgi:hypothetical protein
VRGPSCGASFLGTSLAFGLSVAGDAEVVSNDIASGGALDAVPFGQTGCESVTVLLGSGNVTFDDNDFASGPCVPHHDCLRGSTSCDDILD